MRLKNAIIKGAQDAFIAETNPGKKPAGNVMMNLLRGKMGKILNSDKNKWSFLKTIQNLTGILQSENIPQLLAATRLAIKHLMGAEKVNFLFMDKESVAGFKQDGGVMLEKKVGHFKFNIAIPDFIDSKMHQQWDLVPRFRLIRDVDFEKCYDEDFWVWPIRTHQKDTKYDIQNKGKIFMLLQIEKDISDGHPFNNKNDSRFLGEISKIFFSTYSAITVSRKVDSAKVRAFEILNTCKLSC